MFRLHIKVLASLFLLLFFFSQNLYAQDSKSAVYKGELVFNFNVDTAFVQFGIVNPSIKKIASGDTLIVSNGFYHLFLSFPISEDHYVTRNVLKDSTYTINHNFDLSKNTIDFGSTNASLKYLIGGNTIILTDEDTDIFINNEYKTKEFYSFFVEEKSVKARFENENFRSTELIIKKEIDSPININKFHFYKGQERFQAYLALPGMTYFKEKNYGKLALVLGGLTASTGLFFKYQQEFSSLIPEYKNTRKLYLEEDDESQAIFYAEQMEIQREQFNSVQIKRNVALFGVIGFATIDVVNKIKLSKKIKSRKRKKVDFFIESQLQQYLSVGTSIKF